MADDLVHDRDAAWALLTEWTKSEALLRHALGVEAPVRAYARKFGEDEEAWGNVALLHDFDYERHPTLDQHPAGRRAGAARARATRSGSSTPSSRTATTPACPARRCSSTRCTRATSSPGSSRRAGSCARRGSSTLEPKSVRKKLKQPSFAKGVNRDDVTRGAEELGVDLNEHIAFVIGALRPIATDLGLPG